MSARKGPAKLAAAVQQVNNTLKRFSMVLVNGFEIRKHPAKNSIAAPAISVLYMTPAGSLCLGKTKNAADAKCIALWEMTKITDGASKELFSAGASKVNDRCLSVQGKGTDCFLIEFGEAKERDLLSSKLKQTVSRMHRLPAAIPEDRKLHGTCLVGSALCCSTLACSHARLSAW